MKIVLPFLLALHAMAVDAQFSLLDVVKQTQDLSKLYSIVNASTNLNSLFTAANQYTLFAPSNQALANFLNATSTKQTQADDLEAAIEYSLAHGFFPSTDITTVPQYVATFLTNITYSNVTDGQRMIMSKNSAGIIQIESGGKTTSLVKTPVRTTFNLAVVFRQLTNMV
jgi:transforming growth factor-beta-induced protein